MVRERGRDGEVVRVCEGEKKKEVVVVVGVEGGGGGLKGRKAKRARRRQALIERVIFKAISLSFVCFGAEMRKKKKFTPISRSLTSFLTDVVSALLFN